MTNEPYACHACNGDVVASPSELACVDCGVPDAASLTLDAATEAAIIDAATELNIAPEDVDVTLLAQELGWA